MSSFFGVMFVLFFSFSYFCLFIQAAVLRSIVVPRQPHAGTEQLSVVVASFLFFLLLFLFFGDVAFSEYFYTIIVSLFCMESTSYVFPFRMVFFHLVTMG